MRARRCGLQIYCSILECGPIWYDRNSAIAQLGLNASSHAAARAMALFSSIYGAEAGNLALNSLAIGGVYVCGKIAASAVSLSNAFGLPMRQR